MGQTQELEAEPALCLTLAHLPGVHVQAFHVVTEQLPDLDVPPDAWINLTGVPPSPTPQFILLSDSFSSGIIDLLQGLDYAYPGSVKVGDRQVVAVLGVALLYFVMIACIGKERLA